jgi:hypothetical protein
MSAAKAQPELFPAAAVSGSAEPVSGVPASRFDPAAYDATLTGDRYEWLTDLLANPQPPACQSCGHLMSLPAAAPVLWACPACHPAEAA